LSADIDEELLNNFQWVLGRKAIGQADKG